MLGQTGEKNATLKENNVLPACGCHLGNLF